VPYVKDPDTFPHFVDSEDDSVRLEEELTEIFLQVIALQGEAASLREFSKVSISL
jgi:hypothetical protein